MPKGYPNKKEETADVQLVSAVPSDQSTVRSREELDADKFTEDYLKRNRPNLAGFEQKLAYYGEHPGWVRRWVNDMGNRLTSMLERGWRFVLKSEVGMSSSIGHGNTDIGDKVSVSSTAGEGPMRIFLMETPKKLFDLQMDASLEPVRKTEAAIKGGAFAVKDTENTYQPKGIPNRITVQ